MLFAALVTVLAATVIAATTWMAAAGRLRINPLAGYRFRYFLAGEDAWRAGHRAALLPTVIGAGALAAGGIASAVVDTDDSAAACVFGGCGILLACVVWATLRGNRAALDALATQVDPGTTPGE